MSDNTVTRLNVWLSKSATGKYHIDASKAYEVALAALAKVGITADCGATRDLAYQMIRMRAQDTIADTPGDPRSDGKCLELIFDYSADAKEKYTQKGRRKGRYRTPARTREIYNKIRGRLHG